MSCQKWLAGGVLQKCSSENFTQNSKNAETLMLEFLSNNAAGLQAVFFKRDSSTGIFLRILLSI